jgi:hypothetical protein
VEVDGGDDEEDPGDDIGEGDDDGPRRSHEGTNTKVNWTTTTRY